MTLDDILKKIHRLYQGDTNYPETDDDDYSLRLGLINDAIDKWANEIVYWKELFVNLSDASDGDKTATTSTTSYSTPSNFVSISSWVEITGSNNEKYRYFYVKPDDVLKVLASNSDSLFFYITGKPGNYKINLNNPKAGTIKYSYYKTPTHLSSASDVPEMSKPLFIVYEVLAGLYELDNRNDLVVKYLQLATDTLNQMIIENETKPANHFDKLGDLDYELSGLVIGE